MKFTLNRLFSFMALIVAMLAFTGIASAQNTHAGGQSGSVTNNALIRSVGNNLIDDADITDDGTKITVAGQFVPFSTKTALTPAATVAVNSALGNFFTLTPGEDETINATTVGAQGQILIIKVLTSGTTSRTLTFGTNFKSTGTLATGTTSAKVFVIQFISDGTDYCEVSRTAAQ